MKTLRSLAPYKAIYKAWSAEPSCFRSNPLYQMPQPNFQTQGNRQDILRFSGAKPDNHPKKLQSPALRSHVTERGGHTNTQRAAERGSRSKDETDCCEGANQDTHYGP